MAKLFQIRLLLHPHKNCRIHKLTFWDIITTSDHCFVYKSSTIFNYMGSNICDCFSLTIFQNLKQGHPKLRVVIDIKTAIVMTQFGIYNDVSLKTIHVLKRRVGVTTANCFSCILGVFKYIIEHFNTKQ